VGIGTATAREKLDINQNDANTAIIVEGSDGFAGSYSASLWLRGIKDNQAGLDTFGDIRFSNDDNEGGIAGVFAKIEAQAPGTSDGDAQLVFSTADATILTHAMTIDKNQRVGIGTTTPATGGLHVWGIVSASYYSRRTSIPIIYNGSAYDGYSAPIVIPDKFTSDEYTTKTLSGSCYVRVILNDTTALYVNPGTSASIAGWTTAAPSAPVDFVEGDFIRVHISESKQCVGLSVNVKMTY